MNNLREQNGLTAAFTAGGLAEGTNAGTIKTVSTITYLINGVFKSKAATDNLAFSAGHTALGNSQACLFGVILDASGNVTTVQGPIVAAGDPCPVPVQPDGKLMVGLVKVTTSASGTFTAGTTDLSAAGVTGTYSDVSGPPGSAQ